MEDNQQPSDDGQQTPVEAPEEQSPPEQGQSLSYNPPQPPEKSGKKKMIILLVIILLIAGGAAAWYFLFKSDGDTNNTSNENTSNEEQQSAFTPTYFVQTGPLVEYVNAAGELETEANLAANDVVTDVRNTSDGTRVYYYSTTPDEVGVDTIETLNFSKDGQETKVATIENSGPTYYSEPVLSPDASKFVIEAGYAGNGVMGDIYVYDTASGEGSLIYETNKNLDQTRDLFVIVGWLDDKTVLLQEQTCRECDGPRKAVLNKIDVETGELSDFFNPEDSIETLGWAQFFLSDGKIYVFGGDYGKIFGGDLDTEFAPDELYEVDANSGEPRLITTFTDEFVQLSNVDDGTLYVTLKGLEPTTAENAPFNYEEGSFDFSQPTLVAVDLNNGTTRPVALETKYFTKDSYVKTFINTENSVLFLTETSFTQDVEDPELGLTRKSGVDFAVFELPTGAEETALNLLKEQRSLYDESFVPVQLFKAE